MSNYPTLLPRTSTRLEQDLEQMGLLAGDLGELDLSIINDPYKCPPSMLSWLAYSRHVDNYEESWPEAKKRSVIAGAPEVHLIKGTVASIRDVIRFAGYGEIEIITRGFHWFYNGIRYYNGSIKYGEHSDLGWAQFIIKMQYHLSVVQVEIVRALINATAPARCELLELRYSKSIIYDGSHFYDGQYSYGVD